MKRCYDCPRGCGAARDDGAVGICGGAKHARIAKIINPFEYEEPMFRFGDGGVFRRVFARLFVLSKS